MIIWLASYPRSGNTLTRTILKNVFELPTFSIYNDPYDLSTDDKVSEEVGHLVYTGRAQEFLAANRETSQVVAVKSHHPPEDDSKAVYIVRDGRSATASWYHYLQNLPGHEIGQPILDIIEGKNYVGTWSNHLDQWQPLERPNTLLLRYERLVDDPDTAVNEIADFLGHQPKKEWKNPFDQLRERMPFFFHRGSDAANIADLTESDIAAFMSLNGKWMQKLAYQ